MQFKRVDMNLRRLYWEANYVKPDSVAVHIALKNLKINFFEICIKKRKILAFQNWSYRFKIYHIITNFHSFVEGILHQYENKGERGVEETPLDNVAP